MLQNTMEPKTQLIFSEFESLLGQYIENYSEAASFDVAKGKIEAYIHDLLGFGTSRLMSFMYLVDVKEERYNDVMNSLPENEWPSALAQLVIERLLQKVYTRIQYRK